MPASRGDPGDFAMCRYLAYLGPPVAISELVYKPSNSLVHQASAAMRSLTRINADGFGVGWYAPEISPEPAVFKDTSPVWNNYNLGSIAGKIRSPAIVAHVRAANSFDPVHRDNCHPFARGRLLWMHNGDIPGRGRLTRQVAQAAGDTLLAMIRGNTDTELALTLFLSHLDDPLAGEPDVDQLATAMRRTLEQCVAWHRQAADERTLELNFCVTDGRILVATRFALPTEASPTLHWLETGSEGDGCSVLIASEPLDEAPGWQEAPPAVMLLVRPDRSLEHRSLADLG